jgi:hypothetical protein
MSIPNLKRVTVSSETDLRNWLTKETTPEQSVMLVTHTKASPEKHLSNEEIAGAVSDHSWTAGRRYTLNGTLIGQVIHRA